MLMQDEVKNIDLVKRIRWIKYKEKFILYFDYSNFLTSDEIIETIQAANRYVKELGKNDILLLVDVTNSIAKEDIVLDALKNNALIVKPYVKKAGVFGVAVSQGIILTLVNMFSSLNIKPFNTKFDALEWLVE
jgi:hypothetical protein